jgi:hypothetical protein
VPAPANVTSVRIPDTIFADLCGGASRPETIAYLGKTQLALRLNLLRYLAGRTDGPRADRVQAALEVLQAARTADPAPVNLLLSEPCFGVWLTTTVRRLRAGAPFSLDRLDATAAAARRRAGIVPPGAPEAGPARRTLRVECDGVCLTVPIEDTDPDRDCYHVPARSHLTDDELAQWHELLTGAWCVLVRHARAYADELATGLLALVPLAPGPGSPPVSATSGPAFGAVALSLPDRPEQLAATLVHEFQHSKLSATLTLLPLYGDGARQPRHFAPWRRDARPISGLIQGAHAFAAVGDLWRRLGADTPPLDASGREYADLLVQLGAALETLRASSHLTADGRVLVAGLDRLFAQLNAVPVQADRLAAAHIRLATQRRAWQEHNAAMLDAAAASTGAVAPVS